MLLSSGHNMYTVEHPLETTVVFCAGPRQTSEVHLEMPAGSKVLDAVRASRLLIDLSEEAIDQLALGIWGRKVSAGQTLRNKDRVEIYRPLLVDPKVARRERFTRQGAKSAGLFARRRPGSKAGY